MVDPLGVTAGATAAADEREARRHTLGGGI